MIKQQTRARWIHSQFKRLRGSGMTRNTSRALDLGWCGCSESFQLGEFPGVLIWWVFEFWWLLNDNSKWFAELRFLLRFHKKQTQNTNVPHEIRREMAFRCLHYARICLNASRWFCGSKTRTRSENWMHLIHWQKHAPRSTYETTHVTTGARQPVAHNSINC